MPLVDTVLIVDVETTGNDNPQVIEIGKVLYSVRHKSIISTHSEVIKPDGFTGNQAELINRIPNDLIDHNGARINTIDGRYELFPPLSFFLPDYCIAHNAEYEQKFINSDRVPWLCTYTDFELFPPEYTGSRGLTALAQFYGVGISVTHRAIYDCLLIAEIFNRIPDLQGAFEIATSPKVEAIAPRTEPPKGFRWDNNLHGWVAHEALVRGVSVPTIPLGERVLVSARVSYNDRQLAKDWGFQWNGDAKRWERLIAPEMQNKLPFLVSLI